MIRRLFPFWQSARLETVLGISAGAAAVSLELLQPWPIKWLVDSILGSNPPSPWLASWLSLFGPTKSAAAVLGVSVAIVVLALGQKTTNVTSNLLLIRAGEKLVFELRCRAFDQLNRLSLAYHDRTKVGESLYRVAYDAHAAQSLLTGAIVPVLTGGLMFVGILTVMVRLDLTMTLITLATAPAFLFLIRGFGSRIDDASKQYHAQESALVSAAQESLSSIRAVQAFTMEAQSTVRFRHQAGQSLWHHLRLIQRQLHFAGWVGVVMALGTAAVAGVGATRVLAGNLSVGDVLVFLAYLGMLYQPVNAFCQSSTVAQAAGAQLRRVFEVIDAVPAVSDSPRPRTLARVRGAIQFRDVSFSYEPDQPVLQHINLNVPPGTVVALVGRSGAGKTSCASLLTRFYDPIEGAVLLDGTDLRELELQWLRQQVGVVLQDPILFAGTVRDNIAIGRPGASMDEITLAARRAQLHDDVASFPAGYETVLGERGVNLSGGQRQRLSIARALLKNAPILILDEPTSALDVQTEAGLLAALTELMRGRTTFIIAHRLSTVGMADLIVVLQQGQIIERGTHSELVLKGGTYAQMLENYRRGPRSAPNEVLQSL
jgi:ATP-binding cassette, subfamily B, bacterial